MPRPDPFRALALLVLAGCAATRGDPWQRADEVFRDGDLVGLVDVRRDDRDVDLVWCGVRAEGESRMTAVRMVVFCDANGDLEPQSTEQLAVWDARSPTPVDRFWVDSEYRSTNVPAEELERLWVLTELRVEGRAEPVRQSRKLP
jgi:hypothetical protein